MKSNYLKGKPATEKTFNRLRNIKSCKSIRTKRVQQDDSSIKAIRYQLNLQSKANGNDLFFH